VLFLRVLVWLQKLFQKRIKKTFAGLKRGCIFAPAYGDRENESEVSDKAFKVLKKR